MGGGVTVEPFDPAGDLEQALRDGFGFRDGLEPGLALDRFLQRHRLARRIGNQFGDAIHQTQRHLQHASGVAHRGAGLQRSQRDDMGDTVGAIFVAHIAHDFVAPLLAEIDIEVRHRDTFRIEEALEKKTEAQGIQIGDVQRPGHQRGRAGSAYAHGDTLALGPFHEIRNDQEIAGEPHAVDDGKLIGQSFAIDIFVCRKFVGGHALGQPFFRLGLQLVLGIAPRFRHEHRQDGLALHRPVSATAGDLDRIVERLGQVRELRRHLGRRLEPMLARQAAAVILRYEAPIGDAEQRIMRLVHRGGTEVHVIGGNQRQISGIGQVDQRRFGGPFLRQVVTLQFDIEAIVEDRRQPIQQRCSGIGLPFQQQRVDGPARPPGEGDQTFGVFGQHAQLHMRPIAGLGLEIGGTEKLGEIAIADVILDQKRQIRRLLAAARLGYRRWCQFDRQQRTDNGLHTRFRHGVGDLIDAEEIVAVGNGNSRHAAFGRQHRQLFRLHCTFKERIGALHPQVNKGRHFAGSSHGARGTERFLATIARQDRSVRTICGVSTVRELPSPHARRWPAQKTTP